MGLDHANDIKTPRASVSRFTNIAQLDGGGGHSMLIIGIVALFTPIYKIIKNGWSNYSSLYAIL